MPLNLLWRALRDFDPVVEDGDPIGDPHHEFEIVLDHDDGNPHLLAEIFDPKHEIIFLFGGHPRRRPNGRSPTRRSRIACSSRKSMICSTWARWATSSCHHAGVAKAARKKPPWKCRWRPSNRFSST